MGAVLLRIAVRSQDSQVMLKPIVFKQKRGTGVGVKHGQVLGLKRQDFAPRGSNKKPDAANSTRRIYPKQRRTIQSEADSYF
jgi:hypothetical protein